MNLKMYKACQKVSCEEFPNFLTSAESYCTGEVVGNLEKIIAKTLSILTAIFQVNLG